MVKIDLSSIDLSKLKKGHLIVTCALLIIVIMFFSYQSIFRPLAGEIKETSRQLGQKERDLQRAKRVVDLEGLEKGIKAIKGELGIYQQGLKAPADIPQILEALDKVARRQRIEFTSLTPLEAKEVLLPWGEESLLEVPIKMQLRCGYHELGIFINQVENAGRFMKVTNLRVKADSGNIWSHQVELVIASYSIASKGDLQKR